ncbi:MAG: hypothetical protein XD76_0595 [candidate division TA06 bacterium 32_111]|uniref:Uncharacterized protein n=2 Tax=Bacteria candidate phyla TaxID=1783234 RepID=A0A101I2X6_UNCT6|nr:MAG: hypothetical protein XD76_0595 [candidate division TA06 bacterium 32_111]KUK87781.1 MAG: hypothetical protein XE03_0300 [candidate division TA06 bacterium 34_109]HAF07936.1 hypothetical protein [candidate division WOR-3 bacterium]HCP16362.1 hypothetical protein [candidate division WOR-3 bacterium]
METNKNYNQIIIFFEENSFSVYKRKNEKEQQIYININDNISKRSQIEPIDVKYIFFKNESGFLNIASTEKIGKKTTFSEIISNYDDFGKDSIETILYEIKRHIEYSESYKIIIVCEKEEDFTIVKQSFSEMNNIESIKFQPLSEKDLEISKIYPILRRENKIYENRIVQFREPIRVSKEKFSYELISENENIKLIIKSDSDSIKRFYTNIFIDFILNREYFFKVYENENRRIKEEIDKIKDLNLRIENLLKRLDLLFN